MTKINKLGKSSFVIAILSFLLVAVLAFGGTYAYFSDRASATSSKVTLGHLNLEANAFDAIDVSEELKVVPNQPILEEAISATVDANIAYFIRAKITINAVTYKKDVNEVTHTEDDSCDDVDEADLITWGTTSKSDWTELDGYFYIEERIDPSENTWTGTHSITFDAKINEEVGNGGSKHYMDAEFTVTVTFEVCQADHIDVTEYTAANIAQAFGSAQLADEA